MRRLAVLMVLAGCAEDATPEFAPAPGPAVGRRLTRSEYLASVEVVLGVELDPERVGLPQDHRVPDGFRNSAQDLLMTPARVAAYDRAAEEIARSVDLDRIDACRDPSDACRTAFVQRAGLLLLRRPLPEPEQALFRDLFSGEDSFDDGARLVLRGMLQSPRFIYRLEVPAAHVDRWELASRLSFLIWGSAPDAELLTGESFDLEAQLSRMLAHQRARRAFRTYVEQWLYLDAIPETLAVGDLMKEETYRLFERVAWEENADLMRVFTEETAEIPPEIAELYGLELQASGVYQLEEVPERIGFLTNAAVLSARTFNPESSMIDRGIFVLNDLLCQSIPSPETPELRAAIEEARVPVSSGLSQRARFAQQAEDPLCAGCHGVFDPLGLAFEQYGPAGQFLTEDEFGNPLSGGGALQVADLSGPYPDIESFARMLGGSDAVARCMVKKSLQHALGRALTQEDDRAVEEVYTTFVAEGRTYQALLTTIATHATFSGGTP